MADPKAELIAVAGKNNVLDGLKNLNDYASDSSFALNMKPKFVVKVENADQVQKIVAWANNTRTPLVPVSSGPPHFHGDTVPSVPGAVIVDLSGMKKILNDNRRNRMAVIEPGVTYSELQPALTKQGLRLSTSLLPRANKSVITSLLEREPRLTARYQWSSMDPLRSMEIVWGDGNKLWSGGAGHDKLDLPTQWQQQKWQNDPAGPGQTDFYRFLSAAQGSMGFATWAAVKCEVLPRIHNLFLIPAKKLEDLIDFICRILRLRYADELFILNNTSLACMLGDDPTRIKVLQGQLPPWAVILCIAGRDELPEERVEFQQKDIEEIAAQFGLKLMPSVPGAAGEQVLKTILSPSTEPYWKNRFKGAYQDIFFITTLDRTPGFVKTMSRAAGDKGYSVSDIGVYLQPRHQGVNCHCEFILPYSPKEQVAKSNIESLFKDASETLSNEGAFFTRPYGIWADMAFKRDGQTTNLLKNIKNTFDPNNIMNPGKLCFKV